MIPPGASLNLSGLNIYPSAAATARRNAVNAMLALDGPLRALPAAHIEAMAQRAVAMVEQGLAG